MQVWKNKTAIVTGAGSGIGSALVRALGARGATVIATDLHGGGGVRVLDVRDEEAFRRLADDVAAQHGAIDFLFNNAGTGVAGEAHELRAEHWHHVLDVNLGGTINGILAVYPRMRERGTGHIVNVASLAGLGAAPFLAPYAASKHAIVGLSISLRAEAADAGVAVNVVCPAAIDTPLLDRDNPPDLPPVSWRPNIRRFLTSLAGAPYSVDAFAEETLDAIARNEAVIVIPARARLAWRLGRWVPGLVEKAVMKAVREERKRSAADRA
jgi:NAD(P)-dependent dehydrogenase (short-subunit alcohol dehydrogenase family)